MNIDLELPSSSNVEIVITNFNGKSIQKIEKTNFNQGVIELDLNNLLIGVYNCSVITNDRTYNKSFVVMK